MIEGKANQEISYLHHAGLLLDFSLDTEDGGDVLLPKRRLVLQGIARRYVPEHVTLHNHRFENFKCLK
jgi:hypothetical protein